MTAGLSEDGQPVHHIARQLSAHPDADWLWIHSAGPIRTADPITVLQVDRARGSGVLKLASGSLPGWDGYCLDLFGCAVRLHDDPPWPQWGGIFNEADAGVQIWRLKAYLPNAHAFAELLWPTDVGVSKSIHLVQGWESLSPTAQDREVLGATGGMRAIEFFAGGKGRPRLEDDPGWRALMRDIDTYLKKPSASLKNAVGHFGLADVGEFDTDAFDAEIEGEDIEEKRRRAALARLKQHRSRWKKLPEFKKKAEFT